MKSCWIIYPNFVCNLSIRLMDTAREMIKESLPIKCLEAVILGLYPLKMFLTGC